MKELLKKLIRRLLGWYIDPICQENERQQAQIERQQGQLEQQQTQIEQQQAQIEEQKAQSEQQKNQIEQQKAQAEYFQELIEQHTAQLEQQQIQIELQKSKIERQQGQLEQQQAQIEQQKVQQEEQIRQQKAQMEQQQIQIKQQETQSGHLQEQIEQYAAQMEQILNQQKDQLLERFEGHDRRLTDIEQREAWTRKRFEGHDQRLSDIEHREEWTRERFEGHDKRIDDQESRVDAIDERISQVQIAIEAGQSTADRRDLAMTFAQSGEDAIAAYILRFLQLPVSEITYLDLGANHAKELSNTYYFYTLGARGVLVEANPELIPELKRERPEDIVLNVAIGLESGQKIDFYVLNGDGLSTVSFEEAQEACRQNSELFIKGRYKVNTCTVKEIIDQYFEKAPTILSIDLEGLEESILTQMDLEKCKPWIIILENIPYTPLLSIDQREFKCADYLESAGYTEYAFTGINSIFVLREAVEAFNHRRKNQLEEQKDER